MKLIFLIAIMILPAGLIAQTKNDLPDFSIPMSGPEGCPSPNKKVVFEVTVTSKGEVTTLHVIENRDSVSAENIKQLEDQIRTLEMVPKTAQVPPESAGKITFCIKEN